MVSVGIFSMVPPTEPCALRSTQLLKVSTRDFSCGKGGRCVWLTTYHPCSAETSRNSGALTYPEPLRPPRPVAGDLYFFLWRYRNFRQPAVLFNIFSSVSFCRSGASSVRGMTRFRAGRCRNWDSTLSTGQEFLAFTNRPDLFWGTPSLLFKGY